MKVYLDTSVMVALILQQSGSPEQRRWLSGNATELLISSYGSGEFVDTVARNVRHHTLTVVEGADVVARVQSNPQGWIGHETLDADVAGGASLIAADMTRGLKLGDAIHLAACRRLGATLLTGDRQQAAAAAAFGIAHHLILADPET